MYGQKTLWHLYSCLAANHGDKVCTNVLTIHMHQPYLVAIKWLAYLYLHSNHLHSLGTYLWYQVPIYLASYPGWGRGRARGFGSQLWFIQSCVITGFQWMGQ